MNNHNKPIIIKTKDGSPTIFLPEIDEQYHSTNGAITESWHVYIDAGYNYCKKDAPTVFEVGLGTGLNCLITALEADTKKRKTLYIAIEKYPLEHHIINQLNYYDNFNKQAKNIFDAIHQADWHTEVKISEYCTLIKYKLDFTTEELPSQNKFDVVYFDAFGPDKQQEMWKIENLQKVANQVDNKGIIVTYSAKGAVRRNWQKLGFEMERLPGPPGKKEMLRGIKKY